MKHISVFQIATLVTGFFLAACSNQVSPMSTVTPTPTSVPESTLATPTALVSPTAKAEPSITPTPSSFTGTEVSFDRLSLVIPPAIAVGGSGTIVAETKKDEVAPYDVAPEHIQFTLDSYALQDKFLQPNIYVYPAQTYAQLQEFGLAAQSLERLRAVLAQSSMVNVKELPGVPFFNVSQTLAAQVKVIPFQNGRGVRMVTQYAMAHAYINNHELIYHFEGLTEDEQYYVVAILPVTAPGLPEDGQPGSVVPADGVSVPDYNDMSANWMGYYGDVRQMLQGLELGAFTPKLDQVDALIGSLSITSSN
jgi:hypothetical protein